MQTRALRTLLSIADVGSFAETAKRLNMTLSAVSMQMKGLEQELDTVLFDRTFRPPRLTVLGREVAKRARSIIQTEDQLRKLCQPMGELRGTFRVGFVLTASVRVLPRFLQTARVCVPNAQFELETGLSEQLERDLLSGRLDCAVLTVADTEHPLLDYAVLQTEPLVYALPVRFAGRPISWMMRHLQFLHFAPNSGIGRLITTHLEDLPEHPVSTLHLDGIEATMECVKQGIGFAMLPEPDVARYADEKVEIRALDTKPITRDLALVALTDHFSEHHWASLRDLFI